MPIDVVEKSWYAVQTRARYERVASTALLTRGYEVFCPESRTSGSRQSRTAGALFPGYIFCRQTCSRSEKIVTAPGVIRIVGLGARPTTLNESEIEHVRIIAQSDIARSPWRYLPDGTRIRIETGPLRMLEGFLVWAPDSRRLVVSVPLLQRSVSVELDENTRWVRIC